MKPERIILVRHGESEGNVDKNIYSEKPDYSVRLTPKGRLQANQAGVQLKQVTRGEPIFFYVSSYHRTRETFQELIKPLEETMLHYREDPRLREQEWQGKLRKADSVQEREREKFGHFYYRFEGGESCADVYDRQSDFMDTLFRDFEKPEFPRNCAIIGHGMQIRVFLMRWFHLTVEDFELLRNPRNCETIVMNKMASGKYQLEKPLRKHDKPDHPYQFPIIGR